MTRSIPRFVWPVPAVAAAIAVRAALQPWLGSRAPFATLFLAVLSSALLGGWAAGALATVLGMAAAAYFVLPPGSAFQVDNEVSLVLYFFVCAVTVVLVEAQRRARARADAATSAAEEHRAGLEAEAAKRERAEAAERVQREWLQVTLASIGDGVIATDIDGRIRFLNSAAAAITGWDAPDAAGRPIESVFDIRNEDTGETVENPLRRAIREGRVIGLANHTVLVARNGEVVPIDDSGAPIKDAVGRAVGAVLVFRDVREVRARERDLQQRDRMIECAHDAVIVADAGRRILRWNTGARELYGWEEAEAKGRAIHELLQTEGEFPVAAIDAILMREDRWDGTLAHTCRDGRHIVVESRQVLLRGAHEAAYILEINRDITARLQAERDVLRNAAEAEEGHRTLETLMTCIPEGITIADAPDARIRMVSRYGADLAGQPRENLEQIPAARQPEVWGFVHSDGLTPARSEELPLARAVRHGEEIVDEEWALRRPDGSVVSILCNAGPIRNSGGQITGGLSAWRDITQRKRLEEKVR